MSAAGQPTSSQITAAQSERAGMDRSAGKQAQKPTVPVRAVACGGAPRGASGLRAGGAAWANRRWIHRKILPSARRTSASNAGPCMWCLSVTGPTGAVESLQHLAFQLMEAFNPCISCLYII